MYSLFGNFFVHIFFEIYFFTWLSSDAEGLIEPHCLVPDSTLVWYNGVLKIFPMLKQVDTLFLGSESALLVVSSCLKSVYFHSIFKGNFAPLYASTRDYKHQ